MNTTTAQTDIPLPTLSGAGEPGPEQDYQTFVALMSAYQANHLRGTGVLGVIDRMIQRISEKHRHALVECKQRADLLFAQIRKLVSENPAWWADKKSISTPFGTAKSTSTSALEPINEELAIMRIRAELDEHQAAALIRQKEELNLEALEQLDDASLSRIRVRRVHSESFTITPAKMKLADAIKAPKGKGAAK